MGNLVWKCIPPSPSPPSFSPLPPQTRARSCSLFVGSIEKGIENKCYFLLKYLSDTKILSTRSVYCLWGFMAVAGGFLEGDFERHLKASWQIISANSKSAGWLLFTSNFLCEARFPLGLSTRLFLFLKLNKCPGFQGHSESQCSHLERVTNSYFRRRIQATIKNIMLLH